MQVFNLFLLIISSAVILWSNYVQSVNILTIATLASPSHYIFHDVFLEELVERGYNITLLSHDGRVTNHPNYTQIILEGVYNQLDNEYELTNFKDLTTYESNIMLWDYHIKTCEADFKTQGLRTIMNYPNEFRFDLVIWDINSILCLYPLIEKFGNPPIIATNPYVNQPNTFRGVFQSYIPHMLLRYTDRMTTWQRLHSNFWSLVSEILRYYYYRPKIIQMVQEYFGEVNTTFDEFDKSINLVLANYNPICNYVEALPTNLVPVGGLHIRTNSLPTEFQDILDSARNGVILLSFGTNIKAANLKKEKFEAILSALSRLPQTVIWKFDGIHLENVPNNVHIKKYVPQVDILMHSNTKLFITHCGLLSTHEVYYAGVPVIAVPFYLDQHLNAGSLQAKGLGEIIDFEDITSDSFYNIIIKVLEDERYKENSKRHSKLYKDFPAKPMEKLFGGLNMFCAMVQRPILILLPEI